MISGNSIHKLSLKAIFVYSCKVLSMYYTKVLIKSLYK